MASIFRHTRLLILSFVLIVTAVSCNRPATVREADSPGADDEFPEELVSFIPYDNNPVFTGTGTGTWDTNIRERGYILKESDGYHLWYTGYGNEDEPVMKLGYATSPDGIAWTRYAGNPIFTESWVEDMIVIHRDDVYYMFAEGRDDIAHLLTSRNKIKWDDHGSLVIRQTNGEPLTPGPYGTPTVITDGDTWHLFYERNDQGIWHATSADLKEWKNVQDEPVITMGPESYDKFGVAMNQIIRHGEYYYGYYHGTPVEDWSDWNTNVAVSKDLDHWKKFEGNPLLKENKSSGILVNDGTQFRMYTMHKHVQLHYPAK